MPSHVFDVEARGRQLGVLADGGIELPAVEARRVGQVAIGGGGTLRVAEGR